MNSRRKFLKSGLAATLAAPSLLATDKIPAASLPKVRFGDVEISRLVMGCNQFYGFSHFNRLLDKLMVDWNTPERICQTLLQCQQNGINAYQYAHNPASLEHLEMFRSKGGNMHLIAVDAAIGAVEETVRRSKAGALYHHGEVTDKLFRAGQMDKVQEYTKKVRQTGVRVGIGTHKPEVVEYAEEHGWDVDFYVLCAYNRTRTPEEIRKLLGVLPVPANELYIDTDLFPHCLSRLADFSVHEVAVLSPQKTQRQLLPIFVEKPVAPGLPACFGEEGLRSLRVIGIPLVQVHVLET